MTISIEQRIIPAMTLVGYRGVVPTYSDEGQLWGTMGPALEEQAITPIGPCGVIELDECYKPDGPELFIFVPVDEETSSTVTGPLEVVHLPKRVCAVATVTGSYSQIHTAHQMMDAYITGNGLQTATGVDRDAIASKRFSIYVTDPGTTTEDEQITEVHIPLGLDPEHDADGDCGHNH